MSAQDYGVQTKRDGYEEWRTLPRPATLPACPSWCDYDHADDFGPDAIPYDTTARPEGGPTWVLPHTRYVTVGGAEVRLFQHVEILPDGSVVHEKPPEVSWAGTDGGTPARAAEMSAALLAATALLARDASGTLVAIREPMTSAADALAMYHAG